MTTPHPTQIGRYTITNPIAETNMSAVYLAAHPTITSRTVVIKLLHGNQAHKDEWRQRFKREVHLMDKLEGLHVVPIYDYNEHEGQPYLVMRYMQGGSLHQQLTSRRHPYTLEETADLLSQIAPTLDQIHKRGIIHRDLKPENILFDERNTPYLTDFGIAKHRNATKKATDPTQAQVTINQQVMGTPQYMSPEQWTVGGRVDAQSDLYALGIIAFVMITGKLPYRPTPAKSLQDLHTTAPIPDATKLTPYLPPYIDTVFHKALAKTPTDRYPSAQSFIQALRGTDVSPASPPNSFSGPTAVTGQHAPPAQPLPQPNHSSQSTPSPFRRYLNSGVWVTPAIIMLMLVLALIIISQITQGG